MCSLSICQVLTPTRSLTGALTCMHHLHLKTASLSISSPPFGSAAAFVDWVNFGSCKGCADPSTPLTSPVCCSLPLRCHLLGYILTCCGRIISQSDFPHSPPPQPQHLSLAFAFHSLALKSWKSHHQCRLSLPAPCLTWEYTHARCNSHSEYIVSICPLWSDPMNDHIMSGLCQGYASQFLYRHSHRCWKICRKKVVRKGVETS